MTFVQTRTAVGLLLAQGFLLGCTNLHVPTRRKTPNNVFFLKKGTNQNSQNKLSQFQK